MYDQAGLLDVLADNPSLRLMRPLPKRRRAVTPTRPPPPVASATTPAAHNKFHSNDADRVEGDAEDLAVHPLQQPQQRQQIPIGDSQQLIRNQTSQSQSRTMTTIDHGSTQPTYSLTTDAGPGGDGAAGAPGTHGEMDDAPDYNDSLLIQGNKKKRKVPNANGRFADGGSGGREDGVDGMDGPNPHHMYQNSPAGIGIAGGDEQNVHSASSERTSSSSSSFPPSRRRLSAITHAGLRYKTLMQERRRLMAAVLEGEQHLDPVALEHALTTRFPYMDAQAQDDRPRIRRSRRLGSRISPSTSTPGDTSIASITSTASSRIVPEGSFEYECTSAASERLLAERMQVSRLRDQFQQELDRQATAAAVLAEEEAARAVHGTRPPGPLSRTLPDATGGASPSSNGPPPPVGNGKKKKKKRSALANASNPHHLRNYVPSRLPNSRPGNAAAQAAQESQNLISPLPLRFLNAQLPSSDPDSTSRSSTTGGAAAVGTAPASASDEANTTDEWICPFCEYNLFYGDERAYQQALRSRKKILRRRRRARERAAAAANGKPVAPKTGHGNPNAQAAGHEEEDEEEDALFSPPHDDVPASITSQMKWKSAKDPEQRRAAG